jgi:hypothetical protein
VPDLVVAAYGAATVDVLLGQGGGTFAPRRAFTASDAAWVTPADLNHDGRVDLVFADPVGSWVGVLPGTPRSHCR